MSAFYDEMAQMAYDLITEFGTTVTITRKNTVENPVTGVIPAPVVAETTGTFKAVNPIASMGKIEAFDNRMIGPAADMGMSIRFMIIAALNATFEPAALDILTMDSRNYSILGCTPVAPAGSGSQIVYRIGVAV